MADALHISGELLKSYARRRALPERLREKLADQPEGELLARNLEPGLRAVVLGANAALSSAVANDMPDRDVGYAQELLALARPGDMLFGISTSGNARNVAYAAQTAALGDDGHRVHRRRRTAGGTRRYCHPRRPAPPTARKAADPELPRPVRDAGKCVFG